MGFPRMLDVDEPEAVAVINPAGRAPFLLIGDHGGRRVPRALADLGLPASELARHIGWDIGVTALGQALAARLDAVFVHQIYSRLVIDCNRDPAAPDAMPAVSDGTVVPGNAALDDAARAARIATIHAPYHAAIRDEIGRRTADRRPTALVALHSFTPALGSVTGVTPAVGSVAGLTPALGSVTGLTPAGGGVARPWHCGILHDGANDGLARAMLAALQAEPDLIVGDNEPYAMDGIDYTVPRHTFGRGLPYVEIEVRQDLLADDAGIAAWASRLARLLPVALTR